MRIAPLHQKAERGFVLIASLLLLLVMTLIALAMFHSFGIQELVAGNVREKQRALQSAMAAEQYAEIWLTAPGNALSSTMDCSAEPLQAYTSTSVPWICAQPLGSLTTVTSVPWIYGTITTERGWTFFPGSTSGTGDLNISTSGGSNTYYQAPRFYIALLSATATQSVYRIDAWNYGGTANTAAVVEANYMIVCGTCSTAGP